MMEANSDSGWRDEKLIWTRNTRNTRNLLREGDRRPVTKGAGAKREALFAQVIPSRERRKDANADYGRLASGSVRDEFFTMSHMAFVSFVYFVFNKNKNLLKSFDKQKISVILAPVYMAIRFFSFVSWSIRNHDLQTIIGTVLWLGLRQDGIKNQRIRE